MDVSFRVREVDPGTVGRLVGELGIRPITARCLVARGIVGASDARSYLDPRLGQLRHPTGLAGLPAAVTRLRQAVEGNQRVGIFGDYDVDGITTAALMTSYLRQLGVSVVARIARRDAGYGFSCADADSFASAGCALVVTGDCGTSDVDAIARASERGVDVIVVDHHTVPARDEEHPALALINPFREDSTFPFRDMASVGLSFYLMAALRTELRQGRYFVARAEPDLRELLDLVALGTVADLVPLAHENRILTVAGLRVLARRQRPGLAALCQAARLDASQRIDERTISWKLAPRLNAPGRMGDAEPALALLLATDPASAARWAERLEQANDERRVAQDRVLAEAMATLADREPGPAVVVAGEGWPSGVTGIVAARLVDIWQRPVFVLAIDRENSDGDSARARGSARSPNGPGVPNAVNLYDVMHDCAPLLERYGGHAAAGGLTVRVDRIAELTRALEAAVTARLGRAPAAGGFSGLIDAEVGLADIDAQLCHELGNLAPFGRGNEQPLLVCRGMRVRSSRRVGDGSHLELQVEDRSGITRRGIGFGLGDRDPGPGAVIDAAFAPTINEWQGERRVELEIRGIDSRAGAREDSVAASRERSHPREPVDARRDSASEPAPCAASLSA